MAVQQLLSTWKGYMDKATYPGTLTAVEKIVGQSALLAILMGKNLERLPNEKGDMAIKFNKTWNKGKEKRIKIDKAQLFETEDELTDLGIQFGDEVQASTPSRSVITGEIYPFEIGYAQEYTESDIMEISGYSDQERADWIMEQDKNKWQYIGLHLAKQLYEGAPKSGDTTVGELTRNSDGVKRPTAIGLKTIISSSDYAGLSTTDWTYWQAHSWDMGSALFGHAADDLDTVAKLTAAPTGSKVPRYLDIIEHCYMNLDQSKKYYLMVNPKFYYYVVRRCIELFQIPGIVGQSTGDSYGIFGMGAMKGNGINISTPETFSMCGGKVIITPEPAFLNRQYLLPLDKQYFINQDDLVLEAWANKNFVSSDFDITTKYGTMMKKTEAALRFYAKRRQGLGVLTLDSAVVSELDGYTGDAYTSKTA